MDSKLIFEILMRENADMLHAFLRSAIRDEHAVDDLFQETMLTAWKRLGDFDRSKPLAPWLRGIATHLTLAYYRQQAKRSRSMDHATLDWLENQFSQLQNLPGDTLVEKLAALRDCVQLLPDHYRLPVQMRYSEDRTLAETGASLRLSMEALKKRLTRAKEQLAQCIDRKLATAGHTS